MNNSRFVLNDSALPLLERIIMRLFGCAIKRVLFRLKYLNRNVIIQPKADIIRGTKFEGYNFIGSNSKFKGIIGYGSYIGDNCNINANVGRFSCIAAGTHTINGFHPTKDYVSVHPAFFSDKHKQLLTFGINTGYKEFRYVNDDGIWVEIGNDVWIGTNSLILSGIRIGDGAVIAAGAVVVKDIEPYAIYGGVPARKIGQRFSDEIIRELMAIKWWDMSLEWIKENATLFSDIDRFVKTTKRENEAIQSQS